jgi:lipoprotein NlpD
MLLVGCADSPRETQELYVVRPQDTVYSIAWRYGLDFRDLARWNDIGPEFHIVVGQTLVLSGPRGSHSVTSPPSRRPPIASSPNTPVAPPPSSSRAATALSWAWPTDPLSAPRPVPGGGLLLSGHLGQDVRAACAGRVVYIGNGLRGYGNLIIIKHGENLLTAYAHNRDTLVHEGEEVTLSQVIGHMGEGAPQTPVLYFEIRLGGKPVDPIGYLPLLK